MLYRHDLRLFQHSSRVAELCLQIGEQLGLSENDLRDVVKAAFLHDLGKVNIPLEILDSPRSLQHHEWMIIKQHPSHGVDMLRNCHFHSHIIDGIQSHHEWYDGSGYPSNLKGEAIPWQGRIIAIADSLDAMISYRPYKSPKTPKQSLRELKEMSEIQYDPYIVDKFVKSDKAILKGIGCPQRALELRKIII